MKFISAAALVSCALVLAACGGRDEEAGQAQSGAAPAAPAPELTDAQRQTLLASLPAPYNAADLTAGRRQFGKCRSCHTLTPGGSNLTGPNLHGVFGRRAASQGDYQFSDQLEAANITWTPETMDPWIANPRAMVPGTKMTFVGIRDAAQRRDLIAYLMTETGAARPAG